MHPGIPRATAARAEGGFSLVEILVVITIIALLMTLGFGAMQNVMENGRVVGCQDNLRQIGQGMITYKNIRTKGRWPRESGARFLLTLYKDKQITGRDVNCFLCPGTPSDYNDGGESGEPGSSYDDWESISSETLSYAGRDVDTHPIRSSDDAVEIIAADDNEFVGNHKSVTNMLYGNGQVVPFDLQVDGSQYIEEFPALADLGYMIVGPDSPHPDLMKLRAD